MKVSIILGTRPEIIKMSPVIRECERLDLDYFIIHTGQHYSYNMDRVFFKQLRLPEVRYNLDVGSGARVLCSSMLIQLTINQSRSSLEAAPAEAISEDFSLSEPIQPHEIQRILSYQFPLPGVPEAEAITLTKDS